MTGAVPARLVRVEGATQVEWVFTDGLPFTEPFFEQTLARLTRTNPANRPDRRPRGALATLRHTASAVAPAAIVFHVSRCGSTLVSQMLAALPSHIVVSEAPVLDDILRAPRHDPTVTDDDRIASLRGAIAAFAYPKTPHESRLFVKLDCWHIFHLPLVRRAFPGVPLVFVHRHPLEVLVSLMRMPSMTLVRDVVTPTQLGLTAVERDALAPEAHAAAILGAFFRAATGHRAALVPVAYEQLPGFIWESFPGRDFSPDERALLQAAGSRDAKNPGQRFTADSATKRREASPALLAACARWAQPAYQAWLDLLSADRLSCLSAKNESAPRSKAAPIPSDS